MIYHIHNSALAAQTKIDLMAWIGILPEPHATLHQLEIRSYRTALVDENVEAEHLQIIEEKIPMVHNLMDDGLGILMKKLETQDCIDCGKCDDLKNIIIQLMDFHNNDVDAIIAEIEEKFGDIEASKGGGMPGHRTDGNGPGIRVVELGRGEGNMMDCTSEKAKILSQTSLPKSSVLTIKINCIKILYRSLIVPSIHPP